VAAFPVAPRKGRTGIVVVLGLLVTSVAAIAAALISEGHTHRDMIVALAGLTVLVGSQAWLWRRQHRLTADLRHSESSFRTLVKSSPDPVVILDGRLRVVYASEALADLLGFDPARVVGRGIADAVHPEDAPTLFAALENPSGKDDEVAVRTARVRHADGRWRLLQATVRDLRADPDVGALVLYCRDVTAGAPAPVDTALLELSLTDTVTGLPNRAALVRRLGELQRERAGAPAALALVGVDGLKDGLLTPEAEATVLRALTARLSRALRGDDWLARGKDGDFVVLVDGTVADAEVLAARLVTTVRPVTTACGTVRLTAAAGVTALDDDIDTGEVMRRGDLALRSARAGGPGSVHRYDDALRLEQDRRAGLRTDLDGALERGELRLVFQPVVDLVLHRTVSVEALLRWRHPDFGDVSPTEFVPLAEETPLITELTRWVLLEACTTVAALPDTDLGVAVNVSARHIRSGELVPDVVAALEVSGLHASRLVVEITESVLLDDSHVIEDLSALRQLGVRVAVDDFGTGFSSLAYLVGMPVDVLKMDQHFIANVEHDPQRRALCRAVLQLGTSLGLPVIVEGVTTPTELTLLRDMGHRYLQGFVFARPLEADQLREGAWQAAFPAGPSPVPVPRAAESPVLPS
jgi:PAS domain S-box-containing protein/diguanylate cyclase (GGDEF)-like protein